MTLDLLLDGLSFPESPRWHEDRLWLCDWGAHRLLAIDGDGHTETIAEVRSFPFCIDWRADGRLLITSAAQRAVVTLEPDGSQPTYCDLSSLGPHPPLNEIVADGRGNAYTDGGGFDLMAGDPPAPGTIALVEPTGVARTVADAIQFGNGMAITADGGTLIVAESYAARLTAFSIGADGGLSERRVWAQLPGSAPDGICLDAEGAVWYADVPNHHCQRVAEGGRVLATVAVDRGCFACALGGADGDTLYVIARRWQGAGDMTAGDGSGQVLTTRAPAPRAA